MRIEIAGKSCVLGVRELRLRGVTIKGLEGTSLYDKLQKVTILRSGGGAIRSTNFIKYY